MVVYMGPIEDSHAVIQFFRREAANLRILRKLIVSREKTVVLDVNKDGIEFPGLTYGCATLEELLSDPIILEYMARDGYQGDDIRELLQQARLRNRAHFQGPFLAAQALGCNQAAGANGTAGTC